MGLDGVNGSWVGWVVLGWVMGCGRDVGWGLAWIGGVGLGEVGWGGGICGWGLAWVMGVDGWSRGGTGVYRMGLAFVGQ